MKRTTIIPVAVCIVAAGAGLYWWSVRDGVGSSPADGASASGLQQGSTGGDNQIATNPEQWLSDTVHTVVNKEPVGLGVRKSAVKSLSRNLTSHELAALMDFMNGDRPEDCPPRHWHALVDDIINVLRRQNKTTPGLTQALVHMYNDNDDVVLKDYAVQYLRCWYVDRESYVGHETDPYGRDLILRTLVHAAAQTTQTYSGTALMALHAVVSSPELKKEPVTQQQIQSYLHNYDTLLLAAAKNPQTNKHCRISALQVCAMRGLNDILPTARGLAADKKTDTNIRISAIAAIGRLGTPEQDAQLLKTLEKQGRRLAYAAKPALKKLTR